MHIDDYHFGSIIIDGETYVSDVLIFSDHIRSEWWRRQGHELHIDDLKCVMQAKPKILIVGTGYYGRLRILPATQQHITKAKIELITEKTTKACQLYNDYDKSKKEVVAALHLTC